MKACQVMSLKKDSQIAQAISALSRIAGTAD